MRKVIRKDEYAESMKETFASLERGSIFEEQIGCGHPPLYRIFMCIDRIDESTIQVIEITSISFLSWLEQTECVPIHPYILDVSNKCINKLNTADLGDARAVEFLETSSNMKRQKSSDE